MKANTYGSPFSEPCYPLGDSGSKECIGFLASNTHAGYCIGAHKLGQQTRFDAMPCPTQDDSSLYPFTFILVSTLGKNEYFTTITFAGETVETGNTGKYSFMPGTTDNLHVLAVPSQSTNYEIIMSPKIGASYPAFGN